MSVELLNSFRNASTCPTATSKKPSITAAGWLAHFLTVSDNMKKEIGTAIGTADVSGYARSAQAKVSWYAILSVYPMRQRGWCNWILVLVWLLRMRSGGIWVTSDTGINQSGFGWSFVSDAVSLQLISVMFVFGRVRILLCRGLSYSSIKYWRTCSCYHTLDQQSHFRKTE